MKSQRPTQSNNRATSHITGSRHHAPSVKAIVEDISAGEARRGSALAGEARRGSAPADIDLQIHRGNLEFDTGKILFIFANKRTGKTSLVQNIIAKNAFTNVWVHTPTPQQWSSLANKCTTDFPSFYKSIVTKQSASKSPKNLTLIIDNIDELDKIGILRDASFKNLIRNSTKLNVNIIVTAVVPLQMSPEFHSLVDCIIIGKLPVKYRKIVYGYCGHIFQTEENFDTLVEECTGKNYEFLIIHNNGTDSDPTKCIVDNVFWCRSDAGENIKGRNAPGANKSTVTANTAALMKPEELIDYTDRPAEKFDSKPLEKSAIDASERGGIDYSEKSGVDTTRNTIKNRKTVVAKPSTNSIGNCVSNLKCIDDNVSLSKYVGNIAPTTVTIHPKPDATQQSAESTKDDQIDTFKERDYTLGMPAWLAASNYKRSIRPKYTPVLISSDLTIPPIQPPVKPTQPIQNAPLSNAPFTSSQTPQESISSVNDTPIATGDATPNIAVHNSPIANQPDTTIKQENSNAAADTTNIAQMNDTAQATTPLDQKSATINEDATRIIDMVPRDNKKDVDYILRAEQGETHSVMGYDRSRRKRHQSAKSRKTRNHSENETVQLESAHDGEDLHIYDNTQYLDEYEELETAAHDAHYRGSEIHVDENVGFFY